MAAQSGDEGGAGGAGGLQRSHQMSLAKRSSLYSLTLNEVESHLGQPLSSMNLDELLRSVLPLETNQALENWGQCAYVTSLQCRPLRKKTVDQVWGDIKKGQRKKGRERQRLGRRLTLGEMTLEDFLEMAGVVAGGFDADKHEDNVIKNVAHNRGSNPTGIVQDYVQDQQWLQQYQQMPRVDQQQRIPQNKLGAFKGQSNMSPPATTGALSASHTTGWKRSASEVVEDKLVDRRQKRMIKNRESAARSRARKLVLCFSICFLFVFYMHSAFCLPDEMQ
ncbi:Abscisic acid-insensitive 5-like protein 2 [Apostasia shenzhenica]|uniref:Abscisic acid-insensitive 5-like protein 2 n=1 Tax=Apostasia shenzhenica TaxID=1088818 RepID=A0A2I0AXN6_9ASPA|nr:Abscisic acid-insensitive 5-like protein 2 [Apostasia shenzhenica]